jgi:hypothetical protein
MSLFESFCAACTPRLTPLVAACTALVTSLHADSLGLCIGYDQCRRECCNAKGGRTSDEDLVSCSDACGSKVSLLI